MTRGLRLRPAQHHDRPPVAPLSAGAATLDSFTRAFERMSAGCRRTCHCGREFYNADGGWDWEDGELEALRASGAIDLPYAVQEIHFDGHEYVIDCSCWHASARRYAEWIRAYGREVAEFLTLEKRRLQAAADDAPVVRA